MSTQIIAGMAVEVDGTGDAVICIHGLGGTSNTYAAQMPALDGRRVVRPDLPCSGRSALVTSPSIGSFVQAVASMAEALGIRSAHVIGHSLGTIVSQHLAAGHPQLVRSLLLFGAMPEPADGARDALRKRAALARTGAMSEIADTVAAASTSSETKQRNPAAFAFVRESILRQDREGYARTCEVVAIARAADLSHISCPVLLVTGSDDTSTPPSRAQEIAAAIKHARTIVLPRCGHWATIERPEEANAEIRRFIH